MNIVDVRDLNIDALEHEIYVEEEIFDKFDELGCMYIKNVLYDGEIYDRIYRRNNIIYAIKYYSRIIQLFDSDFRPIMESMFEIDENIDDKWHSYLTRNELITRLNNWINPKDFSYRDI